MFPLVSLIISNLDGEFRKQKREREREILSEDKIHKQMSSLKKGIIVLYG